jgi:hypothetical protein
MFLLSTGQSFGSSKNVLDVVTHADGQGEAIAQRPLVLDEGAQRLALVERTACAWHADAHAIRIRAEVVGIVGAITLAERERGVEVALVVADGLRVLPLHAHLEVVVAAFAGDEPRQRVFDLVGIVHA